MTNALHSATLFLDIFGAIGLAGGTVAYFRKGRGDALLSYASNEISLRDGTIARLEKTNAALVAENTALKQQNQTLKDLAQGIPQLVSLTTEIKRMTDEVAKFAKAQGGNNA